MLAFSVGFGGNRSLLLEIVMHVRAVVVDVAEHVDQRALVRVLVGRRCTQSEKVGVVAAGVVVVAVPAIRSRGESLFSWRNEENAYLWLLW